MSHALVLLLKESCDAFVVNILDMVSLSEALKKAEQIVKYNNMPTPPITPLISN